MQTPPTGTPQEPFLPSPAPQPADLQRFGGATCEQRLAEWELARRTGVPMPVPAGDQAADLVVRALDLVTMEASEYLEVLEQAHAAAQAPADRRLACAVSMVAAVIDHGTMSRLDVWLDRYLARATPQAPVRASTPAWAVWLTLGDVAAWVLHGASVDEAQASAAANQLFELINSSGAAVSADTRIIAGQLLLEYGFASSRFELLDLVISLIEHPDVMTPAGAVSQARWFSCRGYLCFMRGDAGGAKRCWREAQAIAARAHLRGAAFMAQIGLVRQLLDEHDIEGADAVLSTLQPAEGPGRSSQVLVYKHVLARCLLLKGQSSAAMRQIEEALDASKLLGIVDSELFLLLQQKAEILFAMGRFAEAEGQVELAMESSTETDRRIQGVNLLLLRALGTLREQDDRKIEAIRQAFLEARAWNFTRFLRSLPNAASQACREALKAGIEVSFVSDTIRERQLRAPDLAGAEWPWHVHVKTLGHAEVRIGGRPLQFPGRTQAKPLELLFYLASAHGMRASNDSIAATLWFDEDSPRSIKSLETTTARLRKVLGDASLVQVLQNQTALDPGRIWSDCIGLAEVAAKLSAAANMADAKWRVDVPLLAQELLALYEGAFLVSSGDAPWMLARRREATQTFVAAAIAVHGSWPPGSPSGSVEAFLESALTHEPLSEVIALKLMRTYASTDRVADALRVFRQLRHQMSVLLGLAPGRDISAFAESLLRREG